MTIGVSFSFLIDCYKREGGWVGTKSDFEVYQLGEILNTLKIQDMFGQGEIGQMDNNEEKIKEKMSLCVLWLGGGKRKYLGGVQAFSTETHTKLFTSKWR